MLKVAAVSPCPCVFHAECIGTPPEPVPTDDSFSWDPLGCELNVGQECAAICNEDAGYVPAPTPPTSVCYIDGSWVAIGGACVKREWGLPGVLNKEEGGGQLGGGARGGGEAPHSTHS